VITEYLFTDSYFTEEFNQYLQVRGKGLKKQANKMLDALMLYFDKLDCNVQDKITEEFCLLRDAGKIKEPQHSFAERLKTVLFRACEQNRMPHLRWYYEFTNIWSFLQRAYSHADCDELTVNRMLSEYFETLWFGQHHFSEDVCLIEKSVAESTLKDVENLMDKHDISPEQKSTYFYYKNLYSDWYTWKEKSKSNSTAVTFREWCFENNRDYKWITAIYYDSSAN